MVIKSLQKQDSYKVRVSLAMSLLAACFLGIPSLVSAASVNAVSNTEIVLYSREFRVTINRTTGMPAKIESLFPSPMSMWDDPSKSMELAIDNKGIGNNRTVFRQLVSCHTWATKEFAASESVLNSNEPGARAVLVVRVYDDRINLSARMSFRNGVKEPLILRFSQPFDARKWERQVFFEPQGRVRPVSPDSTCIRAYVDSGSDRVIGDYALGDWTAKHLNTQNVPNWPLDRINYPRGILEANDRYLLYGDLDVNRPAVFAAGWLGTCPCSLKMPRSINAGDCFTFNLIYKVFPKPKNTLADVCSWYSRSIYSSNKLSRGLVTLSADHTPRTLLPGNAASGYSDKCLNEQTGLHIVHLWFGKPDEIPATGSSKESALMEEIRSWQKRGYKVYAYFRQLALDSEFHNDSPRFREWALSPYPGMLWAWGEGPIPETSVKWNGDLDLAEDFCNPKYVSWYIADVKRFIDRYRPDGIAWDMGWDTYIGPCRRHPSSGINHGILRVQKEIWEYIKKKYPKMRVIQNESIGSPSMLYCDAVMSEDGTGISAEMVANVDHYRLGLTGLYYVWIYKAIYKDDWQRMYIHDVMRGLSLGFAWGIGNFSVDMPDKPDLLKMKDVASFSAYVNTLHRVIETQTLDLGGNNKLTGCVWAWGKRMMLAIYNDGDIALDLKAIVNSNILAATPYKYNGKGPERLTVIGSDGLPATGDMTVKQESGNYVIAGSLAPHHLLLGE